jgi:hypothetical protein
MRFPFVTLALLVALAGAPALAKPDYPSKLDAACRAEGRTPPNPAELARATGATLADCALCHDFNLAIGAFPSGGNVNADGDAYKSGSLDPFCVAVAMNQPPVLDPIGNQAVNVGEPLALLISASDPDSAVSFFATGLPAGASFVETGPGTASFDWTPDEAGNFQVTFEVSDGLASDSESVVISVGGVNAPPLLDPIGDHSVPVGDTLTLAISATDPEGQPLVFSATGLPADAGFQDLGGGSAELVFAPSAAGQASVTVSVTDSGTPPESASATFLLSAQDPGSAEGPALDSATWDARKAKLAVRGSGAALGERVTIVDATSEAALAVARAEDDGSFEVKARTFLAPCSVRARGASGTLGDALDVKNAPADCGTRLLTRARARWRCEGGTLAVSGEGAPASSDLAVLDAATDAVLVEGQANSRGRFELRTHGAGAPASVELRLSSGAGEWTLGPIPVRDAGLACEADDDEDDLEEAHERLRRDRHHEREEED